MEGQQQHSGRKQAKENTRNKMPGFVSGSK
jgi:hypothetical protein